MSKKLKPRWGWEDSGLFNPVMLDDSHFNTIAEVLSVEALNSETKTVLQDVVTDFCAELQRNPQIPRWGEVRKALDEIESTSKKLALCMEQIDTLSKNKMEDAALSHNHFGELLSVIKKIEARESDIHIIASTASEALSTLPPPRTKGPAKEKDPLRGFIADLAIIFEKVTGKRTPYPTQNNYKDSKEKIGGIFFCFVKKTLSIVDPKGLYTDDGISEQIKNTLRWLRSLKEPPTFESLKHVPTFLR